MGNDAIKDAIIKHLKKDNLLNEDFYISLQEEVVQLNALRSDADNGLLELKKNVINSNLHLIIDRIFKGDNEGVIKMLKNTRDKEYIYNSSRPSKIKRAKNRVVNLTISSIRRVLSSSYFCGR